MTAGALLALLRRFWPAIAFIAVSALAILFRVQRDDARQTIKNDRLAYTAAVQQADLRQAQQERGFAQQIAAASSTFADRLAARAPIILRSTNTVREYAQTDAGRVRCRSAERVRDVDALDAELADPDPRSAIRSDRPLPNDTTASAAGR